MTQPPTPPVELETIVVGNILNLTPHDVRITPSARATVVFPRSGTVARLVGKPQRPLGMLPGELLVVSPQEFTGVEPADPTQVGRTEDPSASQSLEFAPDAVIVSALVAEYVTAHSSPGWWDLVILAPDTGPEGVLRDGAGTIVGARRFVRYQ